MNAISTDRGITIGAIMGGTLMRDMLLVAAGSILLAILSQITVPFFPVPMTLQTLGVMFIGLTFGWRLATATVLLYLAEGLMGAPVFSGFSSGYLFMLGGTGGYLLGFLAAVAAMGVMVDLGFARTLPGAVLVACVGELLIFGFGILHLYNLYGLEKALAYGLYPFVLAESVKVALAVAIAKGCLRGLHQALAGSARAI